MRPRMPASWRICLKIPRAPTSPSCRWGSSSASAPSSRRRRPRSRDPRVSTTFSLRSPSVIRPCCQMSLDLLDLQLEAGEDLALAGRRHDVVLGHGHACAGRVGEAEVLDGVEHRRHLARAVDVDEAGDDVADLTLGERPVLPLVLLPSIASDSCSCSAPSIAELKMTRPGVVTSRWSPRRNVIGSCSLISLLSRRSGSRRRRGRPAAGVVGTDRDRVDVLLAIGQVVQADHHVLRRRRERLPCAGERMLFDDSMRMRASAWASTDSGRCTAI